MSRTAEERGYARRIRLTQYGHGTNDGGGKRFHGGLHGCGLRTERRDSGEGDEYERPVAGLDMYAVIRQAIR